MAAANMTLCLECTRGRTGEGREGVPPGEFREPTGHGCEGGREGVAGMGGQVGQMHG